MFVGGELNLPAFRNLMSAERYCGRDEIATQCLLCTCGDILNYMYLAQVRSCGTGNGQHEIEALACRGRRGLNLG